MPKSPAEGPPALHLELPAVEASTETARLQVGAFLAPHGLAEAALFRLELVLEEVLTNQVRHAFADRGPHRLALTVELADEAVVLHFEDDGVPFDPLALPDPQPATSLATATPGGLGVMLVRRNARACRYERRGDRNHLRVEIARGAAAR